MIGADDLVIDAELGAEPDVEARRQHDQPRRNGVAVRQSDDLALRPGRQGRDLGVDKTGVAGNCPRTVLTSVS